MVDIDKYAQINGDIVALVVQAEQMMQNDDLDADRQPDVVGSWEETLPHRLLNRLSKPRGKRVRGERVPDRLEDYRSQIHFVTLP